MTFKITSHIWNMKSKTLAIITALLITSFHHHCFAQVKGVEDLVQQFNLLLHPPAGETQNSLAYTQRFLDLKNKVTALGPESKSSFEQGISQYEKEVGYESLHTLLYQQTSQMVTDTTAGGKAVTASNGAAPAAAQNASADSTVQMQFFDRKHKQLRAMKLKPGDVDAQIKKDGYDISLAGYDFKNHTATITLVRPDGSGSAKITFDTAGDCDWKYKLATGQSVAVHAAADGTSSVKIAEVRKTKK